MQFTILRFDTIGSTNDEAIKQVKFGANEGVCIVAEQQTKGRGRRERIWHSPKNAGLYVSLILRPKIETKFWALITLSAAVAVHDAILETCGLQTDIKWANDVHVNDKKLCGILAETVDIKSVVLGIGINLNCKSVSPELSETATSIESETNVNPSPEDLLQSLLQHLNQVYGVLHEVEGDKKIIAEWIKRSSYAFNKRVCVKLENESFTGTTRGLNEFGALLVENENQFIKTVYAGELVNLRS